ncbi:hypothetical protein LCGC14_2022260 [marine sediment metagenome]|uniref:DUF35 domain-containing protein n=1 Tax=marine sediment metagenome TaxID=412755 RepID=A0A0F9FJL5_9ZZZZ
MTTERRKTVPVPSPDSLPFWEGARRGELLIPFCPACQEYFFYPRPFCPRCFRWEVDWRPSSGRGVLYTFAIQYQPLNPEWIEDIPYVTAVVELEEGVRLFTLLVECEPDPEKIHCGMPVEVVFDPVSEEVTIPRFRPLKEAQ